jgi:CRISPR-associated protein Csa1
VNFSNTATIGGEAVVYFATTDEMRYVQRGLLAEARRAGLSEELRGWSWHEPPLRPIYARPLEIADVVGGLCPTGRDLYLYEERAILHPLARGADDGPLVRAAVASVLAEAKRLIYLHGADAVDELEELAEQAFGQTRGDGCAVDLDERCRERLWRMRAFEVRRVLERVTDVLGSVGAVGADALVELALSITVDVPLSGRFLGLAERIVADAVSFRDGIVYSLAFEPPEERHHLMTAGLALVVESVFERPIDLGCIVYPQVVGRRVEVRRDFHVIGDELRQVFIEERDDRMRIVDDGIDPGLPAECPARCPLLPTCRPKLPSIVALHAGTANPLAAVAE